MLEQAAALTATALSGLVLAHGASWTALCLIAIPKPRTRGPLARVPPLRLAAIVPAHNEAASIQRCVSSLLESARAAAVELRVIVVADNCIDETAAAARSAGAAVLERVDVASRGKPQALKFALAWLRAHDPPEGVIFVDGDSFVSSDLVGRLAWRLADGAVAVQAHYAPTEGDSSVQRLRRLALMLVHWSRPLGAMRLGVTTGLKGNGMALRWDVVEHGFGGAGLAEDAEMTLALCRRGIPVNFEPAATVWGDMAASYATARGQDRRWEGGRLGLAPSALAVGFRSLRQRRFRCAAAAVEVASLSLSLLALTAGATLTLGMAGVGSTALAAAAAASLVSYVTAGLVAARASKRDVAALLEAPRFMAHKAAVFGDLVIHGGPRAWEKTQRS